MSEELLPAGTVLQETYRVERLIGEGGMGAVYEASHLRVRRRFAIKLLFAGVGSAPEAVSRFRREAEITSELGHPNIVEVIDFNHTPSGAPYIVMELLVGESLSCRLTRGPLLELPQVAAILGQVASALEAAHQRGVIHRDLKPQNIFLCQIAAREVVKVLDFGISKVLGSQSVVTRAMAVMGTPNYMSPEQAEGHAAAADARTDIFALGSILYEMLAGRPAFTGESVPSVLYQVVHQQPPPLGELRPDLPAEVIAVVEQAMCKRPEERFDSMTALCRAFLAAAQGEGVSGSELGLSTMQLAALMPPMGTRAGTETGAGAGTGTGTGTGTGLASSRSEAALGREPVSPLSRRLLPVVIAALLLVIGAVVAAAFVMNHDGPPTASEASQVVSSDLRLAAASPDLGLDVSRPPIALVEEQREPEVEVKQQPRQPSPRQRPRTLSLTSKPAGAKVFLGEQLLGETPLANKRIPAGAQTLKLVLKGFVPARRQLPAGAKPVTLSLELVPQASPDAGPLPLTDRPGGAVIAQKQLLGERGRIRPGQRAKLLVDRRQGQGVLSIVVWQHARPIAADIYLDDKHVGQSPLRLEVPAGVHLVEARKGSLRSGVQRVTVSADQVQRVRLALLAQGR